MDAVSAAVPHLTSLKGLKRLLPHRFVGTAAHEWTVRVNHESIRRRF